MQPWVHIAWKYVTTAKNSWLGTTANLGSIGALYNRAMELKDQQEPHVQALGG